MRLRLALVKDFTDGPLLMRALLVAAAIALFAAFLENIVWPG